MLSTNGFLCHGPRGRRKHGGGDEAAKPMGNTALSDEAAGDAECAHSGHECSVAL
jgi:hypothetical protein